MLLQKQSIAIMSKTFNTAAASKTATTPYCKVCHDAGRPVSEYTSHYVKDQPGYKGKVICPTLLNQPCRICHQPGHTSSYCVHYRPLTPLSHREQPRREERYIEREQPRREERYIEREQPRREERYIEREQLRREERYIEREQQKPRREEPRRNYYNSLRDDTERHEREISDRDDSYHRDQERRSKPWLQAALNPSSSSSSHERRAPYAHPHGPRVRLSLESAALSASKHAAVAAPYENRNQEQQNHQPAILDVLKMDLHHAKSWGDEPFECDPQQMFRQLAEECLMSNLTRDDEFDFMAACDNDN